MKNKDYKASAQLFIEAVGGKLNIQSYMHCVTRLRINVINKDIVDIAKVKTSKLTKGINWSSNQFQIILGTGVVEAVYAEVQQILDDPKKEITENKSKDKSLEDFKTQAKNNKERLRNAGGVLGVIQNAMKGLGEIFLPIIPAIVAAGMAMGFAALFKNLGVLKPGSHFTDIVDIVTKTAFDFLIVLVCWSTVKKFGGNPVLGIIVGLMFVSPILPNKGEIASYEAWLKFQNNGGTEEQWKQAFNKLPELVEPWKIGFIKITGYQGSVLPGLFIGIIIAYTEKNLKKIVPSAVNIIITPFLTIVISFTIGLMILGPILLIIESGVLIAVKTLLNIPYGFGTALVAGSLQAIVITGCHQILQGLEMQLVVDGRTNTGAMNGSIFNAIWTVSIISQGGAALAVALKEKNKDDKRLHISSFISTLFGITEPAIFGSNLPKIKPFLYGLAGGAIGGFFVGIFNIRCSGMGVTVLPGLLLYADSVKNLLLIIVGNLIALGSAFILTFFLYKQKNKAKITKANV
ncbi:PTS transporter subunit EIIC [Mesoplasma corruscae]|uniref:PTS system, sucrose-specific IIABC component n=1 Tax=Mesoplasma corruscae TaxID=216874 RepID=A0A2S5RGR9_9MOLU|nr:PTS transporter subunit EIIC [Mesoplasma corruscae]PPE06500.1 PTS system, sucrose-specific IIABC component [Mesoplasma corruscae]